MKKIFFIAIAISISIWGCTKDDIMSYQGDTAMAIYIPQNDPDSTTFSFSSVAPSKTKDTIFLQMRVQGEKSDKDRSVELEVLAGTDAIAGTDYVLPPTVLKAGEVYLNYPVVLLKTAALRTTKKVLRLAVKENADFKKAATGESFGLTSGSRVVSLAKYSIIFNDFYVEPAYWSSFQYYANVGAFSVVKFQFIQSVYGIADLSVLGYGDLLNMRLRLRKALAEYEAISGPLYDEKGVRIVFN